MCVSGFYFSKNVSGSIPGKGAIVAFFAAIPS
jgi:hypothetical protein